MDSTTRFTKTVDHYIRYRPGYPDPLVQFIQKELGLQSESIVADIGSGTGKLSELFLNHGHHLIGIEPNQAMREAAEILLKGFPKFLSIDGTAEHTALDDRSVDYITVGQAFHWFDPRAAKHEFERILRPGGWVLLIWNKRIDEKNSFMQQYQRFLVNHSTDYTLIDLRKIGVDELNAFLGMNNYALRTFEHKQTFNLDGLKGRYLSCSYALPPDHPRYGQAMHTLEDLFHEYQNNENIEMWYRTEVYYAQW